jgi:hypothetical protein
MDFVRWFYYHFKIKTGMADTYRNEQFMKKTDFLYNLEFIILQANLNTGDKRKLKNNLFFIISHLLYSNNFIQN